VSRSVIYFEDCLCAFGCGSVETTQHIFLLCTTFTSLWSLVQSWIGFSGVDPTIISDHFIHFIHATGGGKVRRSFLQLIWLLTSWVVCNERNNRMFNNSIIPIAKLLDKVIALSLGWLKAKNTTFAFGTTSW